MPNHFLKCPKCSMTYNCRGLWMQHYKRHALMDTWDGIPSTPLVGPVPGPVINTTFNNYGTVNVYGLFK